MESSEPQKVDVKSARREIASGNALAVDVREEDEWNEGHVPGAVHVPDGDDAEGGGVESGARLMVIASNGKLAVRAASKLAEQGYDAVAVDGDMDDWVDEDFNVQPTGDVDEDAEIEVD